MDLSKHIYFVKVILLVLLITLPYYLKSQISVNEYTQKLETYEFNDPNPIPTFITNPKIYPYFTFDGYSTKSVLKEFKVVELENKYIKVFILPEIGGKVWGAIDKISGEEFIYKNEVIKYRNISMRGPWTSGGIEFNFGIIGHHPSTATPVDYKIKKNEDGSVSCFVGNIDLPSRTQWRVEIKVKEDQASFLTNALWYNPSSVNQSYYNWMTAAAPARKDLEFYTPGHLYLEHSGDPQNWPIDENGRNLSKYDNNNFGPSKSYHIVGEYNDFFGGYYKDSRYGFGHWGRYEEIPGQKLWLWSQSRAGGIWEDLLTDNDGQYIEFQAGRLFVQYQPAGKYNPISNVKFEPYAVDTWSEAWFPLKNIDGLSEASEFGALHVKRINDSIEIKINPFVSIASDLRILIDGKIYHKEDLLLNPTKVFSSKIMLDENSDFEIIIKNLDLHFKSDKSLKKLDRSFSSKDNNLISDQRLFLEAEEHISFREFDRAKEKLEKIVENDKYNLEAVSYLGELYFRLGLYKKSLEVIKEGLLIDTYNPSLNYIAGISYKKQYNHLDSRESFGWAARSLKYRSNAYSQIADIFLREKNYDEAIEYAEKSLEYNVNNIPSLEIVAISSRYLNNRIKHKKTIEKIEKIDPIHHIISYEKFIIDPSEKNIHKIHLAHQSELNSETYLELALKYYNRGLTNDAIKILNFNQKNIINNIWISYLAKDKKKLITSLEKYKIDYAFPFRLETINVLNWALEVYPNWKLNYLLALNLYGNGLHEESKNILIQINDKIKNPLFYLNRGKILEIYGVNPLKDFEKAYQLNNKNWRVSKALSNYLYQIKEYSKSISILKKSYNENKLNYIIGMDYVKSLVNLKKYINAISILEEIQILPYEHAGEGRELYSNAYIGLAIENLKKLNFNSAIEILKKSKEWPENLGVGKPYNPDERIENYLFSICLEKLNDKTSKNYLSEIIDYSYKNINNISPNHILGYIALKKEKGENIANTFIEDLVKKHGVDSEEISFILNYKENNSNEGFKLLSEVLKLN